MLDLPTKFRLRCRQKMVRAANGSVRYDDPCAIVDHTVRSIISGREVLHLLPLSSSFKNAPSLLHLVFWAVKALQQLL